MKKIIINRCYGGFSLSEEACELLNCKPHDYEKEEKRTNKKLIEIVEKLKEEANGFCAKLEIVEIPDCATDWIITEYDGLESVYYVIDGKIKLI